MTTTPNQLAFKYIQGYKQFRGALAGSEGLSARDGSYSAPRPGS
jgi:hypothetical protein